MATADDDVIIIDGDGEFIVEEDEGASIPVVEVYEAYANAVGEASANAEMFQREAQQAFERAADCVEDWVKNGIDHAMQEYNKTV